MFVLRNRKWAPLVLVVILGFVLYLIKSFSDVGKKKPGPSPKIEKQDPAANINRDHGFDRRTSYLKYSDHAKCRRDCRYISQEEVEGIMQEGKINYNKSDVKNARCPRYAVEGITNDYQRVRIVFAQCNESTTVVTVIDLDTEFACSCPGDDDKYKNRN